MIIEFGKTKDPINKVNKSFELAKSVDGKLTDDFSDSDPAFLVNGFNTDWNYCHVPSMNRYYYVDSFTRQNNKLTLVRLHVDVLKTYADYLTSANVIVNDSHTKTHLPFNDVFSKSNNILVTVKSA